MLKISKTTIAPYGANMYARLILPTAAFIALCATSSAFAFEYEVCLDEKLKWSTTSEFRGADSKSFPKGKVRDAVLESLNIFNENPSTFRYTYKLDTDGINLNNGQNELWGTTDKKLLNGAPAANQNQIDCFWLAGNHVRIKESDTYFDFTDTKKSPFKWSFSTNKAQDFQYGSGNLRSFHSTMIHETGHSVGLQHVSYRYSVMGSDFSHVHVNGSRISAYVGDDTSGGLIFLYGNNSKTWEDLSVTHWKYLGKKGEYSTHQRTKLYDASGAELRKVQINNETGYIVDLGQVVQPEFTFENNGKSSQSNIPIAYFISTDDTIDNGDRKIADALLSKPRDDQPFTATFSVTIPTNLTRGQNYWLGVFVDNQKKLAEKVEENATYIPIQIKK
jgi:hypothetical protein